jgi:hypothetical protein
MDLGSGYFSIADPDPGSTGQISTGSRIRIQHTDKMHFDINVRQVRSIVKAFRLKFKYRPYEFSTMDRIPVP